MTAEDLESISPLVIKLVEQPSPIPHSPLPNPKVKPKYSLMASGAPYAIAATKFHVIVTQGESAETYCSWSMGILSIFE